MKEGNSVTIRRKNKWHMVSTRVYFNISVLLCLSAWIFSASVFQRKRFNLGWKILYLIFDSQVLSWKEQNSENWNLNFKYRNYYLFIVWIPPSSFAWWRSYCNDRLLCWDDWFILIWKMPIQSKVFHDVVQ